MSSRPKRKIARGHQTVASPTGKPARRVTGTAAKTEPATLRHTVAVLEEHMVEINSLYQTLQHRLATLETQLGMGSNLHMAHTRQAEWITAMNTLAAGIAHELNNPLNTIIISTDYALSLHGSTAPNDAYDLEVALHDIAHEAQRCALLIKHLHCLAQSEPSPKWPADLNGIVEQIVKHLKSTLAHKRSTLRCVLSKGLPAVMVNPPEIEQVLRQLITNAMAVTPQDLCITIRTSIYQHTVRLSVQDNGPGIPTERLRHIFDPFYSTRRHQGSMGLGLSFVHRIIADHQGIIRAHSTPGHGTTFVISLPIAPTGGQ
jgi:signal transduction histidine kinase